MTSGRRRVVDTGRCNDRTFTVMGGAGLDAAMIDETDHASGPLGKETLGALSYVRAGLIHAHRPDPFEADVMVDGRSFFDGVTTCVLVGNLGNATGRAAGVPRCLGHRRSAGRRGDHRGGAAGMGIADHQRRPRASGSVAARPVRPGQANRRADEPQATVRAGRRDQGHQ